MNGFFFNQTLLLQRRLSWVFIWIPAIFLSLSLLLFSLLQIPQIQTKCINKLATMISNHTGFDVSIGHINLTWYDHVRFDNIHVYGRHTDSTLIKLHHAEMDVSLGVLLLENRLKADLLVLNKPVLHVIKPNDSTALNLLRFFTELKNILKKHATQQSQISIEIDEIEITDGRFEYFDFRKQLSKIEKNNAQFAYHTINSRLGNFTYMHDSLGFNIRAFTSTNPKNQLSVDQFTGNFSFTKTQMIISDFSLHTGESILNDSLVFNYSTPDNFKYFNDSITFYADFSHTTLSRSKIALLIPTLKLTDENINISGVVRGSIGNLDLKNFRINIGNKSYLTADAQCYGLPNLKETFVNLKIGHAEIHTNDIVSMIPKRAIPYFSKLTKMNIAGDFMGFATDFVAKASLYSSLGNIKTDINFKIHPDNKAYYSGFLSLNTFDLTAIQPHLPLKQVSLKGNINGNGLRVDNAQFDLDASIKSIEYKKYTYTHLLTKGHFEEKYFDGKISINDPNAKFLGNLLVDLRKEKNKFKITGKIDTLNLQPIGILNYPVVLSTSVEVDMQGLKPIDMIGYVKLYHTNIQYKNEKLEIDSIEVKSLFVNHNRIINIQTEGLSATLEGRFNNTNFIKSLKGFQREIGLKMQNIRPTINEYYVSKEKQELDKYELNMNIELGNINKFIQPFDRKFTASKDIHIKGYFKQDSISTLSLFTQIDTLINENFQLFDNQLDINISKSYYNEDILSVIHLSSKQQIWLNKVASNQLYADVIWNRDSILTSFSIDQKQSNVHIDLSSAIHFFNDSINMKILPSAIFFLNKKWLFNPNNNIRYMNQEWKFDQVECFHLNEKLGLNGWYTLSESKTLKLNIENININNFQQLTPIPLNGELNGLLEIQQQFDAIAIESKIQLNNLKLEEHELGNLSSITIWNQFNQRFETAISVTDDTRVTTKILGNIYPHISPSQLNLNILLKKTKIDFLSCILKENFSQIQGYSSGNFSLTGSILSPVLTGKTHIYNGKTHINYLNTDYSFAGIVALDEQSVIFEKIDIKDSEDNDAQLFGKIFHQNFQNITLDMNGKFDEFKILNTTIKENKLYYGDAFGSGDIHFYGSINNIKIKVQAKTEKGTKLSIPLGNLTKYKVNQQDYISFVDLLQDKATTRASDEIKKNQKIKGVALEFDVEITPEAYLELIFDYKAGDIIRGQGYGNINLQMNTEGDFKMFGDYEINNGGYNFTLYNIINKEFDIQKGSTISWYGEPYGAKLNINAKYKQLSSLLPLIDYSSSEKPSIIDSELKKKYPSIVELSLTGPLLTPDINFDVSIEDYPKEKVPSGQLLSLEEIFSAFKTNLKSNEQEMNRQIFSLIVLHSFSSENTFEISSETIGTNFSEFLSNQLSYWATQIDENLEIDVNLDGLNKNAFNDFQLRLSYTFLEGRLRISRDGGIPQKDKENTSTLIGDWTVEYLLTEDGRFKVKMFSRSDINSTTNTTNTNQYKSGFSFEYVKSFDELKQILKPNNK